MQHFRLHRQFCVDYARGLEQARAMNRVAAKRHSKRDERGRFIKQRTNGEHRIDAQSTIRAPLASLQRRITRPTQYNWILPSVGLVTPTYLEMILRGALAGNHVQQYQLFDLMLDTWPELSASIQELTYDVNRREIIYDPFTLEDEKPTPSAIEKTKLVSSVLRRMNPKVEEDENGLEGTVTDLMDGWFRGISVLEVMWDTFDSGDGGMATGPRATAWVQPQQYGFNQQGILGWNTAQSFADTSAYAAPRQIQLDPFPPNKFLIGIHKVKSGTPLAGPMLRALAWWWCAANFSADWLLNLAQVFGLPFRWATYNLGAPEATVNAVCDMLANMGSAGWAAFPEGTTLELKEPTRSTGDSPQASLLDRADRYARMLILGQTMSGQTMLTSGRGGQAFGTVEAQLKEDRLEAASGYVAEIFNTQLIPMILALNYGNTDEPPVCRFLQEDEGTYQDAQRDQILATIGLPIPLSHMRKKYSIPEPEDGEAVLTPPAPKLPPAAGQDNLSKVDKASQGQPVSEQQKNRQDEKQKEVQARLEKIATINDDEVFGREIKKLASELVVAADEGAGRWVTINGNHVFISASHGMVDWNAPQRPGEGWEEYQKRWFDLGDAERETRGLQNMAGLYAWRRATDQQRAKWMEDVSPGKSTIKSGAIKAQDRWVTINGRHILINERHSLIPKSDSKGKMPNGKNVLEHDNADLGLADLKRKSELTTDPKAKAEIDKEIVQRYHELATSHTDIGEASRRDMDQLMHLMTRM